MRVLERSILAALAALAVALAGCSASSVMERLPTAAGGLPEGAPPAPTTPYVYPAVHDVPPPRADKPLTDEQQVKLEKDLQTARDRLDKERKADQATDQKEAAQAKKQAEKPKKPETAGAGENP